MYYLVRGPVSESLYLVFDNGNDTVTTWPSTIVYKTAKHQTGHKVPYGCRSEIIIHAIAFSENREDLVELAAMEAL